MYRPTNHAEYPTKTCCLYWQLVIMPTTVPTNSASSSQLVVALMVGVAVVAVVAVVVVVAVMAVVDAVGVEVVVDAANDIKLTKF